MQDFFQIVLQTLHHRDNNLQLILEEELCPKNESAYYHPVFALKLI